MTQKTPAQKIIEMKGRSLGYLSVLSFVLLVAISAFALFFPHLISKSELPHDQLIFICMMAGAIVLIGGIFSFSGNLTIGYILFFLGFYTGCTIALYLKQDPEQFQNSMIALSITVFVATYFLNWKYLISIILMSLSLINMGILISKTNIGDFIVSYIFFNIICLGALWISKLRTNAEKIVIDEAKKDAKLREIGFVSSSIIHEIINPLALIRQSLEVISAKSDESEDGKVDATILHKYMDMAQRHAVNIHEIIKSISSLVKYEENDQLPLFTTGSIIDELKPIVHSFKQEFGIMISLPEEFPDIYLEGKKTEILQILTNLIRNACVVINRKQSGNVWIEINHHLNFFSFKVCDTGPGLSEKIQKRMGKAFNSGSTEGLGLGLSISMALAEKNKGSIRYTKTEQSTCFEVSFLTNRIPASIQPKNVLRSYSGDYAHLFALKENLILIVMRDVQLELTDFKILMTEEFQVIGETPFHYIVITHGADLSKKTREYFNTPEMTKLFLSGSIVGQGKVVNQAVNFFTRIINLPYPVKLFKTFEDADRWVNQLK